MSGHDLGMLFVRNRDDTPWYTRVFRITSIRIISQTLFFSLFMFLLWDDLKTLFQPFFRLLNKKYNIIF